MPDTITVKLFATLGQIYRVPDSTDLSSPRTIEHIITEIGVPKAKVSIIFVDGRHADLEDEVRPGQTLALFPPIGGG